MITSHSCTLMWLTIHARNPALVLLSSVGKRNPRWVYSTYGAWKINTGFSYWPAKQVYCDTISWHVDTRPIPLFLFSLIILLIYVQSLSICAWCISYINWGCWQSYITLSVLMFLWYRQKLFVSLYGTRVPWVNKGQPGSVSKFPPFLWVNLCGGYKEISRYFRASWINRVTLVTKIKLLYSLGY